MSSEPGAYVARYGWTRRSVFVIAASAVFVVAGIALPMSLALRILALVLFGAGGLVMLASVLSRRVALQVDAAGITLGGSPLRYRATTTVIPWPDVSSVLLWTQPLPYGRNMPWISVARREGAPPLARPGRQRFTDATARGLTPVSGALLAAGRPVSMWQLDAPALGAAVSHFAPGVRVIVRDEPSVRTFLGTRRA